LFGCHVVGVVFFGKQQCLRPFVFFCAVFPSFNYSLQYFFSFSVKAMVYFFAGIDSLPFGFYAVILR